MKLNVKKLFAMMLTLALVFSMAACGDNGGNTDNNASSGSNTSNNASSGGNTTGGTNSYTITVEYNADNKDQIPEDMVNQVMFAYSDTNATVETVLTLDSSAMTYILTKTIYTDQIENDEGELDYAFKGEWEFTGSYTVSENDENAVTLAVPTSGKNNIHYPTVLNYQSIEKQTQDWVDSSADPAILTRFNKWYPSKASTAVDQPVTLSGSTMTFGEVNLSVPEEEAPAPADPAPAENDPAEATPADDGVAVDENAIIGAVADGKVINLYADGTFQFAYDKYGIVEEGTWTWVEYVFSGETAGGSTFTAEFNGDYNLAFTYVTDASSAITADFVLENWGDALGADGTYTPAE